MIKYDNIHWLSDEDYAKAKWRYKSNLAEGLRILGFDKYGMEAYIPPAVDLAFRLAEDFSLVTRGVDKIIDIERIDNGRYKADD